MDQRRPAHHNLAGALLGHMRFPQLVSNLPFGGERRNRLLVSCTHEVFSVFAGASGVQRP